MLHCRMTLRETLQHLRRVERPPRSRFWFRSPCYFVRIVDVLVHIVIPELVEGRLPRLADYLRETSPRWGKSWRSWESTSLQQSTSVRLSG
jgi:hypothetical protein